MFQPHRQLSQGVREGTDGCFIRVTDVGNGVAYSSLAHIHVYQFAHVEGCT